MDVRTKTLGCTALTLAVSSVSLVSATAEVQATPAFQLPFPCGQEWVGDSDASSAHESWEIDFNRGSFDDDLGDTVVASAAGTVIVAAYQEDNGYGNLIEIDHGDGWVTVYAHLKGMAVQEGEVVLGGQAIGALGNTSETDPGISPHLHFEQRLGDDYPDSIQEAVFDGVPYDYPDDTVTSANCATNYDPQELCGEGFEPNDSQALGNLGTVNLTWNDDTRENCVTTLKFRATGKKTFVKAYLEPAGESRKKDAGDFRYYAGPVTAEAPGCIKWGGKIKDEPYRSPSEHC